MSSWLSGEGGHSDGLGTRTILHTVEESEWLRRARYVGTGYVAQLAAQLDAIERERRDIDRALEKTARDEEKALDETVEEFDSLVEGLTRAALEAAGFRQHKRGEWRKQRGHDKHSI